MKLIPRLKRMWELSNKDSKTIDVLENLTTEQIKDIPEKGDGTAEFLGEGTTEEYEEMVKEDKGEKGWYDRIKQML